jgi:predicted transcriptional regulator of viral defense system
MKPVETLTKLERLGHSLFETRDLAALLGVANSSATRTANRLADSGAVVRLARGKWSLTRKINRLAIPEHLTAAFPAYISLQSALYYHGMISQIPAITYAVSLARTRTYQTPFGTVSIHHVAANFFFGYALDPTGSAKVAIPEKALVDFLYFRPTRSRSFVSLPELEFPATFDWGKAVEIVKRINSPARRQFATEQLNSIRAALRSKRAGHR